MTIESKSLEERLHQAFGGTPNESRVVARQAVDLADDGQYERDTGVELTNELVIDELSDAPSGTPADRWNWWIGSLEIAYTGYRQFGVQRYRR